VKRKYVMCANVAYTIAVRILRLPAQAVDDSNDLVIKCFDIYIKYLFLVETYLWYVVVVYFT